MVEVRVYLRWFIKVVFLPFRLGHILSEWKPAGGRGLDAKWKSHVDVSTFSFTTAELQHKLTTIN